MTASERGAALTAFHNGSVFRWRHLLSVTQARFEHAFVEAGISPHLLTSRVKSLRSFVEKGLKPGEGDQVFKYDRPDQIHDLVGIRMVVAIAEDIPPLAAIVRQEVTVVEETNRGNEDEAQAPGYQSLHLVARLRADDPAAVEFPGLAGEECIEIQIRSILQDAYASFIHDLDYKAERPVSGRTRRQLGVLASVLDLADREFARVRAEHLGDAAPPEEAVDAQPSSLLDEDFLDEAVRRYVGTAERDSRPWLLELRSVFQALGIESPADLEALDSELQGGERLAVQIRALRPWATGAQVLDALLQRALGTEYLARRAGEVPDHRRGELERALQSELVATNSKKADQ